MLIFLLAIVFYVPSSWAGSDWKQRLKQQDELFVKGEYKRVLPIARLLVSDTAREFGVHHKNYAQAVSRLGLILITQRAWLEAEQNFKIALKIYAEADGAKSEGVAATWNNLGRLYVKAERFIDAE